MKSHLPDFRYGRIAEASGHGLPRPKRFKEPALLRPAMEEKAKAPRHFSARNEGHDQIANRSDLVLAQTGIQRQTEDTRGDTFRNRTIALQLRL